MNTKTSTPAQIDAKIARINGEIAKCENVADYRGRELERSGHKMLDSHRERVTAEINEVLKKIEALREEAAPLHAAYDTKRWSRFFLVEGGHIHATTYCSTCNNGRSLTRFGWLTALSGKSEEEAVAQHGALLCTVCFPSAPVEWTNALELAAQARKNAACKGTGSYFNRNLPYRVGYYSGNWGTCETCRERVTLTTTNKLRTHKAK